MKKLIRINPCLYGVIIITYLLGFLKEYLSMFLILFLHEISHLIVIKAERIEISFIKAEPFGITVRLKDKLLKNPREEIYMAISGPLCNFIIFIICHFFFPRAKYFMYANLSMGLFNLLPAYPLDGGRILRAYLSIKHGYIKSYRFVLILTKITAVLIAVLGIIILWITRFNFFICLTGCFLYFNVLTEKNYSYYYVMREISEYKKKNRNIEKIPVINIAVSPEFHLRKIISDLSFTRYYIFSVIDEGKKVAEFTEGELIEAILNSGSSIKIKDSLNNQR